MKINFFTPLPALRTDIANMSVSVLSELSKIADVTVWTPQEVWRNDPDVNYRIKRFSADDLPVRDIHAADICFYNIGNDARFHRAIFDVARQVPGIAILHDVWLAHFFASYATGSDDDQAYFLSEMELAGLGGDGRRFLAGKIPFQNFCDKNSMVQAVLRPAIGAVIHNKHEAELLEDSQRVPIFYLPLSLSHPVKPAPDRPKIILNQSRDIRIIVFGFIGQNRCIAAILEALSQLPEKIYKLDIYGTLEDSELINNLLIQFDLPNQVQLHGFVEDDILDTALAAADLAINLRNPTMGEASGSQLRIWASALPSIVSRTGWYGTLPLEAVFHVEPGQEIEGVKAFLQAIRIDPIRFKKAGIAGRELLERYHQPNSYAASLVEIASQAPMLYQREAALRMARRGSAVLRSAAGGSPILNLTHPVSRAIHDLMG